MLAQQLCWAAMRGFHQRVTLLVEHGVDVNTPSPRSGRTPYLEALRAGQHGIADYLLAHGAARIALDPVESFALACVAGNRREVQSRLAQIRRSSSVSDTRAALIYCTARWPRSSLTAFA